MTTRAPGQTNATSGAARAALALHGGSPLAYLAYLPLLLAGLWALL